MAEVQALSRELGIEESIAFPGLRNDVPELLRRMDIFVLTSQTEGMPNVVMEALATGLPCVVTDAGDCRNLGRDGETGFVLPIGDVEGLANRVLLLARNGELRRQMGLKARESINGYGVERMAEEYQRFYMEVLNGTQSA